MYLCIYIYTLFHRYLYIYISHIYSIIYIYIYIYTVYNICIYTVYDICILHTHIQNHLQIRVGSPEKDRCFLMNSRDPPSIMMKGGKLCEGNWHLEIENRAPNSGPV